MSKTGDTSAEFKKACLARHIASNRLIDTELTVNRQLRMAGKRKKVVTWRDRWTQMYGDDFEDYCAKL